jgi:hypothetical protein
MPGAPGSGTPTRAAYLPSKGAFLRSFDRLEAILQEALIIEIGEIATQFTLRDMVIYLEQSGFLTTADCRAWAECLSVRRSLLTAGGDRRTPSDAAVEGALATMLQLQVTLIDRRRTLFDEEQEIRDQENADLVTFAGKLHPDETA